MAVPGVLNFGSHIGRATVADEVVGPNFTELWISVSDGPGYDETVAKVQSVVDGYPGLYRDLLTYLTERIKEVLTGTSASIVVRIYGSNMDELRSIASDVSSQMANVKGVTTLKIEPQVLVPQLSIKIRPEAVAQFGLTPGIVMRAVNTLVNGTQVGEIYEDQKIFSVVVRGEDKIHPEPMALRQLMIDTPTGAQVSLESVANVIIVPAPNEIKREGASRRLDVTCNAVGRDLGGVAVDIEKVVLANVKFPTGYHPEFLGEYVEARASRQRIILLSIASVIAIGLILYVDFRSWRVVGLMIMTLPLALLGGVLGVHVTGGIISLGSLVGFVTVLGIAARNAIMLISHYRHLIHEEGEPWGPGLLMRGAEERLAPILMTVLAAGLSLLPLVISGKLPGQEIEYPMAWVILLGLASATLVNLFILPVGCAIFLKQIPASELEREALAPCSVPGENV